MEPHTARNRRKSYHSTPWKGPMTNLCICVFCVSVLLYFWTLPSCFQIAGENIGEWGGEDFSLGKLCVAASKGEPGHHLVCVWVNFDILKGFEGTAFAQHMWSPAEDVKHKLLHPRPSKPSSLRCFLWPKCCWFLLPGCTSATWAFQVRRAKSTPTRISLVLSFQE